MKCLLGVCDGLNLICRRRERERNKKKKRKCDREREREKKTKGRLFLLCEYTSRSLQSTAQKRAPTEPNQAEPLTSNFQHP